jgi:hypothetical protein
MGVSSPAAKSRFILVTCFLVLVGSLVRERRYA